MLDTKNAPMVGSAGSLDEQFARVPSHIRKKLPAVMYEWAVAKLMAAQPAEALTFFEESNALAQRFEVPEMIDASSTGAALVNVLTGEIGHAKQWLESHDASGQSDLSDRIERLGMRGLVEIVSAFVEIGRIGGRSEVMRALEIPAQHEADDLWSLSLTVRSHAAIFAGQQFELLEEFDQQHTRLMERPTDDLMSAMLVSARVDLLLSLGQVFRARAVLNVFRLRAPGVAQGVQFPRTRPRGTHHASG